MNNQTQLSNANPKKNHAPQIRWRLIRIALFLTGGIVGAVCANIIWICLLWKYELAATVMIPMILWATSPIIVIQFSVVIVWLYLSKNKCSGKIENT
jgi:heme/copper-type cytochrome/quinol oxidase subunit 2